MTSAGRSGAPTVAADPKHRFVGAATFEFPIGRGRKFGSDMTGALDAVLGGWQISGIYTYYSGVPLVFGTMVAPESVTKVGETGADKYWFDVTGFARQPAYTRRSNPWYYDGLDGAELQQPRPDAAEVASSSTAGCGCRSGWTPSTPSTA